MSGRRFDAARFDLSQLTGQLQERGAKVGEVRVERAVEERCHHLGRQLLHGEAPAAASSVMGFLAHEANGVTDRRRPRLRIEEVSRQSDPVPAVHDTDRR